MLTVTLFALAVAVAIIAFLLQRVVEARRQVERARQEAVMAHRSAEFGTAFDWINACYAFNCRDALGWAFDNRQWSPEEREELVMLMHENDSAFGPWDPEIEEDEDDGLEKVNFTWTVDPTLSEYEKNLLYKRICDALDTVIRHGMEEVRALRRREARRKEEREHTERMIREANKWMLDQGKLISPPSCPTCRGPVQVRESDGAKWCDQCGLWKPRQEDAA